MFFAGSHHLTIDAKNRLSIPFGVRRKLSEDADGHAFYIVPGRRQGTLSLYAEKYFERTRSVGPADDALSDDAYSYREFEYSQTALLEPDSQGRVLLPERLLQRCGIDKEVALIGVRDHLELWRRTDLESFEDGTWPEYPKKRAVATHELNELAAELGSSTAG